MLTGPPICPYAHMFVYAASRMSGASMCAVRTRMDACHDSPPSSLTEQTSTVRAEVEECLVVRQEA